jgi:hypothetical protein
MSAGAGSFRAAVLLVMLAGNGLGTGFAQAQEPCLSAPNAPAAPGSHWYYRTDPSTRHKCWYMRPRDQAAQTAPVQLTAPVAPAIKPVARTVPALAAPDPSTWTDPVDQSDSANAAWPAAPPSAPPADNAATDGADASSVDLASPPSAAPSPPTAPSLPIASSLPTAQIAPPTPDESAAANKEATGSLSTTAANPDQDTTSSRPNKPPAPQSKATFAILLAGLVGLVLAGLVLRGLVAMIWRALAGRREIKIVRQEPRLIESSAAKRSMPARIRQSPSLVPGQSEINVRISEVEETLREFARRLQQRRSRPRNVFARMGAWVRS